MDESLSSSTNEQTDPIVSGTTSDSTAAMSTAEVLAPCPSTTPSSSKLQTSIEDNHTLHKSLQQYEELHTHKQVESVLDLFTVDELKLLLSSAANDNSGVRSMIFKHADSLNHSPLEALNNNNNNTNNPYQYTNAYDNYNYNNKTSSHGSSNGTPRNNSPHPNGYDHTSDTDSDHYSPFVLPAKADVGYYAYYYKNSTNVSKADFVDEADKRTTASTSSTPRGTAYFWNEQFQEISQKIQDVDLYNEEDAYEKMAHLYQDFVYVVETYARVIISERFLPMGQRSIPPAYYVGGQAGGEKYIVQGILFKFAVDKHGLYGGDNYAAKAAGHDLKSLVQCYKSRTPGLHVPMMCLVDFLGYRLIALSLLPVDRTTLCYGSCDGGQEVYNSDTDFSAKMHVLGQSLNLKEHAAGAGGKSIIGPCDIEGHKGKDNRFYLLDFARLFPPQAPMGLPRHPNEYLYKLLRPELVKSFDVPLSSDAYTLFGKRNADVHNSEVLRATEYLYNVIIPDFAKTLDSSNGTNICSSNNNNNNTSNNILLRANVGEIAPRPRSMNGSMIVQAVLNSFMIHSGEEQSSEAASSSDASTASSSSSPANGSPNGNMSPGNSRNIFHSNTGFIKSLNNLRALKRRSSYSILTSIEGRDNDNKGITHEKLTELMHREGINMRHLGIMRKRVHSSHWRDSLLIEILGRVIKNTIKSKQRQKMEELRTPAVVPYKEVAISYLNLVFGDTPQSQDYWSTELVAVTEDLFEEALYHERLDGSIANLKQRVDHLTLFRAVKRITGMMFSPHCEEHFPCGPEPFQATDLEHMPTKIKEMRIAMYASATGLYLKAKYMTDSKERDRLANIASAQFTSALRTSPDDHMILCNYALLLRLQNRFSEAKVYYKMATRQCPTSARILGHYAWFLQRDMKAFDKAEKYYKRALEVDPSHVRVLSDYGTFLFRIRSDYIQAEECFKQCVKLGYKQAFINYSMFLEHTGKPDEAQYYSELAKSAKGTMIINGKVTY